MYTPIQKIPFMREQSMPQSKDLTVLNAEFVQKTIELLGSLSEEEKEQFTRDGFVVAHNRATIINLCYCGL